MPKTRNPVKIDFKTEIGVSLIFKALLLYLLWFLFFKDPAGESIQDIDITRKIFSLDSASSVQDTTTSIGQP